MDGPARRSAKITELARIQDRISFLYLERCLVNRDSNAITATTERGTVHVPAAAIGCVLLGPGTTVTQQAMLLMADSGTSAVWVGERGVRYYAHGQPLGRNTKLLQAQAAAVSNPRSRLAVARAMYERRFPGEEVSGLTMQQLRGHEGARVRSLYREHSRRTGVSWRGRRYDAANFAAGDVVNQALSAANSALYGVVHAVIVGLGCAPGLGFVHTGHHRSFVYDVADLYKADLTIPLAFDVAAEEPADVGSVTRRRFRDTQHDGQLLTRVVRDLQELLLPTEAEPLEVGDVIYLWDDEVGKVSGGVNYEDVPW